MVIAVPKRYTRIAVVTFALGCLLSTAGRAAPPTVEQMQKPLDFAREVEGGEIANLQLIDKNGRTAIRAMMSKGYRCGLEPAVAWPTGRAGEARTFPPNVGCSKEMRPDICGELDVALRVQWQSPEASFAELFDQLDEALVKGVSVTCTPKGSRSTQYLAERKRAEVQLAAKIDSLHLIPESANSAFRSMLVAGFRCGLTSSDAIRCTRLPSQTEYCYQEEILLGVVWPPGKSVSPQKRVAQLNKAKISTVKALCGLPDIPGDTASVLRPTPQS